MNLGLAHQWIVPTFDALVAQFAESSVSFTEIDALQSSHWDLGEDARLREDARFRPTPWGRWVLSSHLLANDMLYRQLRDADRSELSVVDTLADLKRIVRRPLMFCPKDPRFVHEQGFVRLASGELSNRPKMEWPLELEKYMTHLPLHTLAAVAASEPAGEWGPQAQEELIETMGWVRVRLPGHRLNNRMFVAQIKGNSMNTGNNGLADGAYAVFQLWPSGTKQGKVVLVRGSFSDPETGVYALKKYMADVRDAEGRHQVVQLISLNSDKGKYPDIVLQPESDDALLTVAELIAPLSPADFGREPWPSKKKGERDITSQSAKDKIAERLQKSIETFFSGQAKIHEGIDDEGAQEGVWTARFICLDAESGGLNIEAGPIAGLPPFAKKLQVTSGSMIWPAIASNFRTKTWLLPVAPSSEPYRWSAPGFEDVLDEEFTSMGLDGLSNTSVSIFRIDAAGAGLALTGTILTPGQSYRLLVPPSLSSVRLPESEFFFLGEGWRLWETGIPDTPDTALRTLLESLKLGVGKSEPGLSWVIVPPACYRQATSGESYPCFAVDQFPILHVHGMQQVPEGEAAVFLSGPGQPQVFSLPNGESWTLEIRDLEPGNYMVEVLFQSTGVEPSRLPFAVEEAAVRSVPATMTAVVDGVSYDIHQLGSAVAPGEFSWLEGMVIPISVTGPPLFPVSVIWKSGKARRLKLDALGKDGCLNMEQVQTMTEELRSICRAANLVIDCRELGRLTLQLDRKMDSDELAALLKRHVLDQWQAAEALTGQFDLLRSVWLAPLLRLMNYGTDEMDPAYLVDAPSRTTALKLLETSRTPQGDVIEELRRVLVLTPADADFHKMAPGTVRNYADGLCWDCGVVEAIVTDGLCWFLHKRGSKLRPPIWDLRKLSQDETSFDMDAFLSSCAVGV
jgi:hypothetical protein